MLDGPFLRLILGCVPESTRIPPLILGRSADVRPNVTGATDHSWDIVCVSGRAINDSNQSSMGGLSCLPPVLRLVARLTRPAIHRSYSAMIETRGFLYWIADDIVRMHSPRRNPDDECDSSSVDQISFACLGQEISIPARTVEIEGMFHTLETRDKRICIGSQQFHDSRRFTTSTDGSSAKSAVRNCAPRCCVQLALSVLALLARPPAHTDELKHHSTSPHPFCQRRTNTNQW